ncbi:expressed unknown protein [Seminavis robusta]|uniref:Uncharacterized protein n=1 Tax=Seminavis robusta TaxID=568900 RepID=A0A9N8HS48_9STRA|nr:expressed unknown protein [Seminavis robusta]|eukprot:Sro1395_g269060.1 n/a (182) ;mRNA; f:11495-12149
MVRLKTRWVLTRLDLFQDIIIGSTSPRPDWFPTKKEFAKALKESIISCFGTSASDAAFDVQVRLCDATSRLVLFRVSRENYPKVRASLTMLTTMPVSPTTTSTSTTTSNNNDETSKSQSTISRVTTSVVSVHGSPRTTKLNTMKQLRKAYQRYQQQDPKQKAKLGRELGECLAKVHAMDYI